MEYPILAANSTWYKGTTKRKTITEINIVDIYAETGNETEIWNADAEDNGSIKCYITDTILTIAGNGSGKISLNSDASFTFCDSGMKETFAKVNSINGINLIDSSLATTFFGIFAFCSSLTELDLNTWNTSNVTTLRNAFYGCSALTTLNISNWDISNSIHLFYTFCNCSKLTVLDLNNWDTSKVFSIESIFNGCSALTTLNISNWDTSNVTNMGQAFNKCNSLTTLDVSNWNISKVTNMDHIFNYCESLTTLDVSNWDTSNVTNMGYAFNYCKLLTTLDVSNWNTSEVTNMNYMFDYCESLTTLDVSNWDTSNVTNMGWMFNYCHSLTTLNVTNWNTNKVTDTGSMFQNNSKLKSLDVSNWDTSSVTNMGWMFWGCGELETIDCSKWDVSKVISFHHLFAHCYKLKTIGVENWDVSSAETLNACFHGTANEYLDLSKWNVSKCLNFSQMFEKNYHLKKIKGLENWDTSAGKAFSQMFSDCRSLEELDLSSFNTKNCTYGWKDPYREGSSLEITNGMFMFFGVRCHEVDWTEDYPTYNLRKVTLGENFDFYGDGSEPLILAVLPTPDPTYIPNADGKWYTDSGNTYPPREVPDKVLMTYKAPNPNPKVFIKYSTLVDIANAIREKKGTDIKYSASEMANAILEI